jgi:cardiolipin synthase
METIKEQDYQTIIPIRILAEQVFSRTAGAPLQEGNSVSILKDAKENYPAWIDAISSARDYIHFESYIIHQDDVGQQFADLLIDKAREGVRVKLVYDWLGSLTGKTSSRFWKRLTNAGAEVRCFNPPRLDSPLGWLTRDHRKMISVDGNVAFVTGLCVGRRWVGFPDRSIEPWRDTGVMVRGPAVADIDLAFGQVWAATGDPLPEDELPDPDSIPAAGDVGLRVVASVPNTGGLYRLDLLIAAMARNSLWLTDAYFVGATPYIQALCSAAFDGVDVRLLVPGTTDIPVFSTISRTGYHPLLQAGVRVFEWNGPMIHAKTAVADGRWARVGSTNLNLASWIGNYELDVAVEDVEFGRNMEEMYLEDLTKATEIVLGKRHRVKPLEKRPGWSRAQRRRGRGSVGRAGAGALRIGSAVGAAITDHRILGSDEAKIMVAVSVILLGLAVVSVLWPRWITLPLAFLCAWFSVALVIKAYKLHSSRRREINGVQETGGAEPPEPDRQKKDRT